MDKQTILITGSSGLIGSNLVDLLLKYNYLIIGIAKSFPLMEAQLPQFSNNKYFPIEGDIRDREFIKNTLKEYNPNFIIHLAAQAIVGDAILSADETFDVNIKGTWNLLQEALDLKNLNRIIIASSDKAYGEHSKLPYKEDFELKATHPYDLSKKITEELALSYYNTYSLPIVITRCGNVFGPYDLNMSRIIPGTIKSCIKNEKIILRSNGKQKRCYIYVKDVVRAYHLMMSAPIELVQGEAFNIGNNESLSVIELVEKICFLTKTEKASIIIKDTAHFEIINQSLDSSKAKKLFDWNTNYSFNEAMIETIDWYKSFKNLT